MPSTRQPSSTTGTDALVYALFAALGAVLLFGSTAYLTGNLTNTLNGAGSWSRFSPTQAALHPGEIWPGLSPTALLVGARIVPGVLTAVVLSTAGLLFLRHQAGRRRGLAGRTELRPLLAKESTTKAKSLRPSLSKLPPKEIAPADRGILVGTLGRAEVRASWEDVIVAVMAPRSGKTSGLAIPAILAAPGPVLLTSNKAANDAFTATVDARAQVGTVWTLDPQQIAHPPVIFFAVLQEGRWPPGPA